MKTTYLMHAEYKPLIQKYETSLKNLSQARSLAEKIQGVCGELKAQNISAGSTPSPATTDQPKENFFQAAKATSSLLEEVAKENAMMNRLEGQIQQCERELAAAIKAETKTKIKIAIALLIIIAIALFVWTQWSG